jgi:hypothetical protein
MKAVTQEEPMGCGIACVAFLLKVPYKKAKSMFKHPEHSFTRGFYCGEITNVLNKGELNYSFSKINPDSKKMIRIGAIVFTARNKNYPGGHFLVKTKRGWMNPWINFPLISPAKSGFQSNLPGKIQWVIYPKEY